MSYWPTESFLKSYVIDYALGRAIYNPRVESDFVQGLPDIHDRPYSDAELQPLRANTTSLSTDPGAGGPDPALLAEACLLCPISTAVLTPPQLTRVVDLLLAYRDVFGPLDNQAADVPPFHVELLDPKTPPVHVPPRRYYGDKAECLKREIKEMTEANIIVPSLGPWTFGVVLAPKPPTWRFCIDFTPLNRLIRLDTFPLPAIQDLLAGFAGARFFAHFDLVHGYHQVPVDQASRQYLSFTCSEGTFSFCRMPFGIATAAGFFQQMIQQVMAGVPDADFYQLSPVEDFDPDVNDLRPYLELQGEPGPDGIIILTQPPESGVLQRLFALAHNHPLAGHVAAARTLERIARLVTWPGMRQQISDLCSTCALCQKAKARPSRAPELGTTVVARPYQAVYLDHLGPLPPAGDRLLHVLVMIDRFSRWVEAVAVPSVDARTTTDAFFRQWICRHGPPETIVSDGGTAFTNATLAANVFLRVPINVVGTGTCPFPGFASPLAQEGCAYGGDLHTCPGGDAAPPPPPAASVPAPGGMEGDQGAVCAGSPAPTKPAAANERSLASGVGAIQPAAAPQLPPIIAEPRKAPPARLEKQQNREFRNCAKTRIL
ncbi:putative retrovirus-related Pol polyprotein [Paratrimastix pyriformis]|uniref:Retrovirus-related Pol polyprotein n=1 Tax=Paratrimastix pyriformis TaxID=342808 RepID=A0ABQ8U948_9EUKA|nr:putative retrovirus-related Pol polyprotein [Paratrimastix pyriformis]